ncbi:hypothetical protein pb186bvf_006084 [Paramecium bursaria]
MSLGTIRGQLQYQNQFFIFIIFLSLFHRVYAKFISTSGTCGEYFDINEKSQWLQICPKYFMLILQVIEIHNKTGLISNLEIKKSFLSVIHKKQDCVSSTACNNVENQDYHQNDDF